MLVPLSWYVDQDISFTRQVLRSLFIAQAELLIETCPLSVPLHFLKSCCFAAGTKGNITPAAARCHCGERDTASCVTKQRKELTSLVFREV